MSRRSRNEDPPAPWYDRHDCGRVPRGALSWPLALSWDDLWFALDDGFVTELEAA
jgi:hypothetical protein